MRPDGTISPETAARRFLDSLDQPSRILVAISGGSDSTGLLVALSDALRTDPLSKISLCAATVDHALRPESADEARQVAALCQTLGIPQVTKVWRGAKPKAGIMAAARDARYALLAEAAAELAADIIVTAHTSDDQRETLVMRSTRSDHETTGIADLVLFDRRCWIARPFLACLRQDIRDGLRSREISWLDDPSNDDPKYERVRTRLLLKNQAAGPMGAAAADRRLQLADEAGRWLAEHFVLHPFALGQVLPAAFGSGAVRDYALARLAAALGGQPFAPGREQMQAVLAFIERGERGRMTAGRVVFDLRRNGLFLVRESRGMRALVVAAGERGVWDGRYAVENRSDMDVMVSAPNEVPPTYSLIPVPVTGNQCAQVFGRVKLPHGADAPLLHSRDERRNEGGDGGYGGERGLNLPKSALRRAFAAQPHISASAISADLPNQIHIEPYFALFDRFLTRFDFIFAESLAATFGARPYPKPPLGLIDGKTI